MVWCFPSWSAYHIAASGDCFRPSHFIASSIDYALNLVLHYLRLLSQVTNAAAV
jgi:hypothetical protein